MPNIRQQPNNMLANAYGESDDAYRFDTSSGPRSFMEQNPATEHMTLEDIFRRFQLMQLRKRLQAAMMGREEDRRETNMKQYDNLGISPYKDMNIMPGFKPTGRWM